MGACRGSGTPEASTAPALATQAERRSAIGTEGGGGAEAAESAPCEKRGEEGFEEARSSSSPSPLEPASADTATTPTRSQQSPLIRTIRPAASPGLSSANRSLVVITKSP